MNHMLSSDEPELLTLETEALLKEICDERAADGMDDAVRKMVNRLGANVQKTDGAEGVVQFGLWWPGVDKASAVWLQVTRPLEPVVSWEEDGRWMQREAARFHVPMRVDGEFAWVVAGGIKAGGRGQFGDLYSFIIETRDEDGSEGVVRKHVFDPMALSIPFGLFAPAEVYDMERVCAARKDMDYFINGVMPELSESGRRQSPPVNMLEIHLGTATKEGTMLAMSRVLQRIDSKQTRTGTAKEASAFNPYEQTFLGFDAVQLMPVEPVIEQRDHHCFWREEAVAVEPDATVVPLVPDAPKTLLNIQFRKPSVINWGYDIPLFGSAAINPSLLQTGRPHEFLDLIETFHNLPDRPVKVVLDLVFGHADNQGLELLPGSFFSGPNMYGQDVQFRHPVVRAMLLEMLRRKMQWGIDGIRVDGAQDFKYADPDTGVIQYDDDFLKRLGEEVVHIRGVASGGADREGTLQRLTYRPWMVYEDGRPWPREDWELASTYRAMNDQLDHSFQWAPTIFAYNTPFLYTYWVTKWWRLREVMRFGGRWVSGYANHDTVRRGTQADPFTVRYNTMLGSTLKEVLDTSYNSPATTMLMQAFLPGVPMEFVQALTHTAWSFFRDTDTTYALKVAAEESFFLHWQITPEDFSRDDVFTGVKKYGFSDLASLRRFMHQLSRIIEITEYDQEKIEHILHEIGLMKEWREPSDVAGGDTSEGDTSEGDTSGGDTSGGDGSKDIAPKSAEERLRAFAHAWMRDVAHFCNAETFASGGIGAKSVFNLAAREYRQQNPWLRDSFRPGDRMLYLEPTDGSVIYTGVRRDPGSGKAVFLIAHMEGQPRTVVPSDLWAMVHNAQTGDPSSTIQPASVNKPAPTPALTLSTPGLDPSRFTPAEWSKPVTLRLTEALLYELQPEKTTP